METRLATSGNIAVGLGLKLVCSTLKLCNLHFEVLQFLSIYFGHLKVVTNGSQCGQGRDVQLLVNIEFYHSFKSD